MAAGAPSTRVRSRTRQGEPEFEPVLGGVEAFAGDVLDPGNPVTHGVPMHVQRLGGHFVGSVGLQEGAQRGQELLGLIGGIERAEDGIGVTLQDCAGNMRT